MTVGARRARWQFGRSATLGISILGTSTASAAIARLLGDRPSGALMVGVWLIVLYSGILLAVVDIATRRLPTPLISVASLATGAALLADAAATRQAHTLTTALLAAIALGGGHLILAVAGPSTTGLGDVRMAALLGAALGALGWSEVMWGACLPYAVALPEALARLLSRKPDLAFGPYLLAGALLAVVIVNF
ncbi:peptidase A24 [Micromonospora sp. WMMD980]|uniref:peptidase A24 n=1 Tax=Micromonospora sp. WMMD980 TaxID=3016088 RepID=UPI0024172117|nr:peptidase A24 [Micromonospora sp. WMMD980]MDG4803617.1 peptidase A24 [Micromonospora sp. WMMD980]